MTNNIFMILSLLSKGWFPVNSKQAIGLFEELQRELPQGHILYNKAVKVIADRNGATDDILCQHEDDRNHFTVIHLTWSGKKEMNEKYPYVEFDGTFDELYKKT